MSACQFANCTPKVYFSPHKLFRTPPVPKLRPLHPMYASSVGQTLAQVGPMCKFIGSIHPSVSALALELKEFKEGSLFTWHWTRVNLRGGVWHWYLEEPISIQLLLLKSFRVKEKLNICFLLKHDTEKRRRRKRRRRTGAWSDDNNKTPEHSRTSYVDNFHPEICYVTSWRHTVLSCRHIIGNVTQMGPDISP